MKIKRLTAILLLLVMALGLAATTPAAVNAVEDILMGDVNRDAYINHLDAMLIAQFYVGQIAEEQICYTVADVNGDGFVNHLDAMLVAQFYVGQIDKFPADAGGTQDTYTVTFVDHDGTVLKTEIVEVGSNATAPENPVRDGYLFIGWDQDFSNITSNLTVTAQYRQITATTIMVTNVFALPGESVDIPVVIVNNPGIAGAKITFAFDTRLTLIDASSGDAFVYLQYTKPGRYESPCNFTWDSESGMTVEDGTILILTFEIPADAVSGETFEITCTYRSGDIYNEDLDDIFVEIISGVITVE